MRMFDPQFDPTLDDPDLLTALESLVTEDTDPVPFSGDMGISPRGARQAIRALAARGGHAPDALREWSSTDMSGDAPTDAPTDTPAVYYAALLPTTAADDMPLGIGATAAEALGDLLWALGTPVLLAALAADDPEPIWDDALASDPTDELARSGLW